jgi:hypothetical protein
MAEDKDDKKAPDAEPPKNEPRMAKPGVSNKDEIVKGMGGELFSGKIADIADGDS